MFDRYTVPEISRTMPHLHLVTVKRNMEILHIYEKIESHLRILFSLSVKSVHPSMI